MKKTKLVALSLVLALTLNMMMPFMTVVATTSYTITFTASNGHTILNDGGHLKIDGQFVDLKDSSNNNIGEVNVTGTTGSITVLDGTVGKLNYNSANLFTLYNTNGHNEYVMDSEISSNVVFMIEDYSNPDPDPNSNTNPEPEPNQNPKQNQNNEYKNIEVQYTFSGTTGEVTINGIRAGSEGANWSGTVQNAGYTDSSKNNTIVVTTSFGEPKFSKITINGQDYTFTDDSDMHTIKVPGATSYKITATADSNVKVDRTIIWANPGATDIDSADALIEHGNAKIIAVYDESGNKININEYTQEGSVGGVKDGNGWANIEPGSKVVFEFVPEYGYQLTKVAANEQTLKPQDTPNQYTFTMPNTNVHFAATFTKTEDIVKAESKKISSGAISLGNTLGGGTAQLTVSDVELTKDKIKGFENAAEGYKVSNYLDIDLYNVFYKGKSDSNDVWSNKISELDKEATITLKLADGITADDIVIVHNIHNGDEYEIIEIESYDAKTNTITFKTKSFSNYAIATKASSTIEKTETTDTSSSSTTGDNTITKASSTTEETKTTDNSSNPTTGDNIIMTISIFVISTLGVIITLKFNKNRKIRKH